MIILLIIVLILALILYLPVCLDVKYIDGKLDYKITYAFITFFPKKKKSPKDKPKKKKEKSKIKEKNQNLGEKSSTIEEKTDINLSSNNDNSKSNIEIKKEEKSKSKEDSKTKTKSKMVQQDFFENPDTNFLDSINLVLDIFKAIKEKLGKFIKSLKITNLYINFKIADEDAYECALNFGKMNILVYNILGYLESNFKVKKKSLNIEPKYNSNVSVYDISFRIKIGFGKGLGKILVMIFKVIPVLKNNDII